MRVLAIAAGLMVTASPAAGQATAAAPPKPATADEAYSQIEDYCLRSATRTTEAGEAALRKTFVVSDRMVTRDTEGQIGALVDSIDKCVTDGWVRIVVNAATDPQMKARLTEFAAARRPELRVRNTEAVRTRYASFGYRPSSAVPGPRFGFCEINDDYEINGSYFEHHYVSRVFIDRDPESEIANSTNGNIDIMPKTTAGQRVLNAMAEWARTRYRQPQERDVMECNFYPTVQEAQSAWDGVKGLRSGSGSGYGWIDTGIQ